MSHPAPIDVSPCDLSTFSANDKRKSEDSELLASESVTV